MLSYLEKSPYGMEHHLHGKEDLIKHLEHRQKLEHKILTEVFSERVQFLKSKEW